MFASQRSEALLHVHIADAQLAQCRARLRHSLACSALRRSGSVTISANGVPAIEVHGALPQAVDATLAQVRQLGRVILEMHPVDAHLP